MKSANPKPAELLALTKEEKRSYVIDVITHLAQFQTNPLPNAFTEEWKEIVGEGIEQMWWFLEDFIKREGLN